MWATVVASAERAGRDPGQLRQAVRVNGEPGESLEHLSERLDRLAEDDVDEALIDFLFTFTTVDEILAAAARIAELQRLV
jgi:hypothetical protein